MQASLLAVFAHPDDESLRCGGTLAHYAALGAKVTLVCLTRGEAGRNT
ncbi:PIG-L deacetylase family protein, partial [Enterococcus faecium]